MARLPSDNVTSVKGWNAYATTDGSFYGRYRDDFTGWLDFTGSIDAIVLLRILPG